MFFDITPQAKKTKYIHSILMVHLEEKKHLQEFLSLIKNTDLPKGIQIERRTHLVNEFEKSNRNNIKMQPLFSMKQKEKELNEIEKVYWRDMPKWEQEDKNPYKTILVYFWSKEDRNFFGELVNQNVTNLTKYIYYPKQKKDDLSIFRCACDPILPSKYPVYIISKGRWESRYTSRTLEELHIPYHIVIEPQEYKQYAEVIDSSKILVLPFSNLGQASIPARNWVWEHAISTGAEKHWILDDNIRGFYYTYKNQRYKFVAGNFFRVMEDFMDRYENIAMLGTQYLYFLPKREGRLPITLNTRIYSCILLRNDISHRWRGKFNEDTDLSLRILKDGWNTVLFNAFLCGKMATLTMKGGNTDTVYKQTNRRLEFAEALAKQHPDVARVVWRYNRWHHEVNYSKFKKNVPILKEGVKLTNKVNNFGIQLQECIEGNWKNIKY